MLEVKFGDQLLWSAPDSDPTRMLVEEHPQRGARAWRESRVVSSANGDSRGPAGISPSLSTMFPKPAKSRLTSTTWLVIALFVSLTLLLAQLLPSIASSGAAFRYTFAAWPARHKLSTQLSGNRRTHALPTTALADLQAGLPSFSSIRVVSLKSRTDRRAHMEALARFLRLDNLHFTDAVLYSDPRVLEIVRQVGNHTKADKKIAEVGHVACRMSHRLAIEAADAADDQITLILEDDVDIEAAFTYLAGTILRDIPKDWDIIFFGHTDFSDEARNGPDPSTSNFYIYKSVEPQGGHGYALSRKGRKLVLDLLDNKRPEVYETDRGQPIDEIFVYLARLHRAQLFSIIPDLIVQVPLFKSDIFGTPAGFEDGMHGKRLLDSSLKRIKLAAAAHAPVPDPTAPPPPVSTAIVRAPRRASRHAILF